MRVRYVSIRACAALILAAVLFGPVPAASAQSADVAVLQQEIDALRQELAAVQAEYVERLKALEARLARERAPVPVAPPTNSKIFNPDIAVVGNLLGAAGRNTIDPGPAIEMAESEASFQAIVDPYARADFFMAFGEEGVDLEEGFLTFPAVPGGLLVKVGKMRAALGKVNTLHSHQVSWVDRPLVTGNLVGGEEGVADAGISVARLIDNPWIFLEAIGQIYRGDGGDVFQSSTRGDLSYLGRLRGYRDFTDDTNVDLGVSYARRSQRVWSGRRGRSGSFHDGALECGRHPSMASTAANEVSLFSWSLRVDLESPRAARWAAERVRVLRVR